MNPGDVLDLAHGRAVAVEVVDPDGAAWAELHPDERARAAALAPVRRREWIAGRRALRRALTAAGLADAAALAGVVLAADDRGAPTVPAGAVGSLSHKRELAVALVAPAAGWTIGVDLEVDRSRGIDIARKVLTAAELAALDAEGAAGAARDRAVILAFAIKEAVYKAIDPHLRRYVGFQEVAVWPDADGAVRVEPLADWGLDVEAAWRGLGSHLVCTARARPR
jgi:4'-phosphopantetheinyl transferase EntD